MHHLLSKNANLNNLGLELVHVASNGNIEMMKLIDSAFTNYTYLPNLSDMHSFTYDSRVYQCIRAAITGESTKTNEMIDYLIQKNTNLNNNEDIPLLCVAAYKGNMDIVQRLTDAKAGINDYITPNQQPLYHAYISRNPDIIKYFTDISNYSDEKIVEIKKLSENDEYWTYFQNYV